MLGIVYVSSTAASLPPWQVPPEIEGGGDDALTAPAKEETACIRGSDHGRAMWTAEEIASRTSTAQCSKRLGGGDPSL